MRLIAARADRRRRGFDLGAGARDERHLRAGGGDADAAASPMPRLPPVTRARLPSRRNEGATASSTAGRDHFIACGLIGEPVPPVMISGGPQKKKS